MNNKKLVKVFKAMGNERRFAILKHLAQKKELTVGKIAELINLSFKSVSRHLAVLFAADLIECRQSNTNRFYFLNPNLPNEIRRFIS